MSAEYYNGHRIIRDMPGPKMFYARNKANVRMVIDYPEGPEKQAYVYVHAHCCKYNGKQDNSKDDNLYEKSKFDVLLVDDIYPVFYPVKDSNTGMTTVRQSDTSITCDELAEAMERTKQSYAKHPLKVKGSLFSRPSGVARDCACPIDMLNADDDENMLGRW